MKQIFLDTETTGLSARDGHRIIEVVALAYHQRRPLDEGCFHRFCNPQRDIDAGAQKVHGISAEFLSDKPPFAEFAPILQDFLRGGEIIIHNAAFDCEFLDAEFARCELPPMKQISGRVTCSLEMSRRKNTALRHHRLEDLCRYWGVDDSARVKHSALLDAQLLAQVYYAMTREQMPMNMRAVAAPAVTAAAAVRLVAAKPLEVAAHESYLDDMEKESSVTAIWRRL